MTILLTPLFACGSSDIGYGTTSSTSPTTPCDGAGATSTVAAGHTHEICVAAADLASPPAAGKTYTTSSASGHTHDLVLSADQLASIGRGQTVVATTTSVVGHTHTFSLTASRPTSTPT